MKQPQKLSNVYKPLFRSSPQKAHCLRLFVFKGATTAFTIDFIVQQIQAYSIAVLPAGHWFQLGEADCENCLCVEVEEAFLEERFLRLLCGVEYVPQKVLKPIAEEQFFYEKLQVGQHLKNWLSLLTAEVEARVKAIGGIKASRRHEELAALFRRQITTDLELGLQRNTSTMASDLCVSEATLKRACKAYFGCGPQEIQKVCKILHSLSLLSQPKAGMTTVAQAVGYNGHTAFSRFIKEETGLCPTELRRFLLQDPDNKV